MQNAKQRQIEQANAHAALQASIRACETLELNSDIKITHEAENLRKIQMISI